MKTFCITLVLITIMTFIVFSQGIKDPKTIKISGTVEFFQNFWELKEPPQRGEFETFADYKKRLPKPYDTSQIVYLELNDSPSKKPFSYDIETGRLTFASGKLNTDKFPQYQHNEGVPIEILTTIETKRKYEASNAYGKKVTVEKLYARFYVLNLTNLDVLPDSIYNKDKHSFRLAIIKLPKEAEKLSKRLRLIIGVKPLDPVFSLSECFYTSKPTIDSPEEWVAFHDILDAKFISLILYDETSKKNILQYNE